MNSINAYAVVSQKHDISAPQTTKLRYITYNLFFDDYTIIQNVTTSVIYIFQFNFI